MSRAAAMLIGLTMLGTPVVSTACEIACMMHEESAASGHAGHHLKQSRHGRCGDVVTGAAHLCDHATDGTVAIRCSVHAAPALVASQPFAAFNGNGAAIYRPAAIAKSPPGTVARSTQLRV